MLDDDKPELGIVAGQAARIVPPFVIRAAWKDRTTRASTRRKAMVRT